MWMHCALYSYIDTKCHEVSRGVELFLCLRTQALVSYTYSNYNKNMATRYIEQYYPSVASNLQVNIKSYYVKVLTLGRNWIHHHRDLQL